MTSNTIKRSYRLATLCVAVLAAAAVVLAPIPANADAAIVIKDSGPCGMPGADANGNIIFGGFGETTLTVENGNKVMIKCKGTGITNLSGKGQKFRGFACSLVVPSGGVVVTTDTHATVSKSGVATVTCTFTKP